MPLFIGRGAIGGTSTVVEAGAFASTAAGAERDVRLIATTMMISPDGPTVGKGDKFRATHAEAIRLIERGLADLDLDFDGPGDPGDEA